MKIELVLDNTPDNEWQTLLIDDKVVLSNEVLEAVDILELLQQYPKETFDITVEQV